MTAVSDTADDGRGWGHTNADTLDKLDRRDLRELALVLANIAIELADDDREFARKSRVEIRDALSDHVIRELRLSGRWPYEMAGS